MLKTQTLNYMTRHGVTCEVLDDLSQSQGCSRVFVVRLNHYIDVYRFGEFVKTTTSPMAARAIAAD